MHLSLRAFWTWLELQVVDTELLVITESIRCVRHETNFS